MYKRQIDSIENIKPLEIYKASKKGSYFLLSSFLEAYKPYNGLYINKNKIMLSNVYEKIVLKSKEYNVKNIKTISNNVSAKENILEIDLDEFRYEYRCQNVTYTKKIYFLENTNTLVLDYDILNENEEKVKFYVVPLVTYRDALHMKKANFLKFGNRKVDDGVLINLSVSENENLVFKCKDAKYVLDGSYLNNVKHELTNLDLKKDTFIEDLFVPGQFEVILGSNENKKIKMYISTSDINVQDEEKLEIQKSEINADIEEHYLELKKLVTSIEIFERANVASLPQILSLDNISNVLTDKNYNLYLKDLLNIVKSIDGRYICLNQLRRARRTIENVIATTRKLDVSDLEYDLDFFKLKLWLVEMINKLYVKDEDIVSSVMKDYVGKLLIDIQQLFNDKSYEIVRDIETVVLMYNAVRIYGEIFKDPSYDQISDDISEYIINNFWNEPKRLLKRNLGDLEMSPNIEMLYAVSLSYSPLPKDIKTKLLDTIFRELYTPYGLRTIAKTSSFANGLIYPKYMAHFITANLNQNGSSYVSKKIAYNLVKDLLLDIGKYVENNVKYVYSEKGLDIDYKVLDLYTTSEMIRLYSMFM